MTPRSFHVLIILVSVALWGGCASPADQGVDDGFEQRYKAYQGYVRAGRAAVNKKDYIEAIDQYSEGIKLSPFVAANYYYRGLAWYRKGNNERAIEDLNKVIILDPRWQQAYVYRGLSRLNRGEYQQALSDYTKALNLNAKDATVHNNLAWLYASAKDEKFQDKGKALEHAKKAAELTRERNADILDTLAKAYFINGKVKEALEAEKKALKLDPENEAFKEHLLVYEQAVKNLGSPEMSVGQETR